MNPELKTAWLNALKSGDYAKGIHYLHREDNTYCCLGVLRKVAAVTPGPWQDEAKKQLAETTPHMAMLEDSEHKIYGLGSNFCWNVAGVNDNADTFEPAIDYIKKHV